MTGQPRWQSQMNRRVIRVTIICKHPEPEPTGQARHQASINMFVNELDNCHVNITDKVWWEYWREPGVLARCFHCLSLCSCLVPAEIISSKKPPVRLLESDNGQHLITIEITPDLNKRLGRTFLLSVSVVINIEIKIYFQKLVMASSPTLQVLHSV